MELKTYWGDVIFALDGAKTVLELVTAALVAKKSLRGADLRGADLYGADLSGANLSDANLRSADLRGADLSDANLRSADLSDADLRGADLRGANLRSADLSDANLRSADLCGADLRGANLRSADLSDANLRSADLRGADLSGKKVHSLRIYAGLYRYDVYAVVLQDGTRMVKMGCLFNSLEEWEHIGIRESNVGEYPNDGSEKCEERVAAFEFAKAAVLRMALPEAKEVSQ